MPMLTREMIAQQQMVRNAARLSTPSTPSSHSSSRTPSLSSSPVSTSSTLSCSPGQNSRSHTRPDKCWVPNLDDVSRAEPDERARLFARLAREAERDARYGTPRAPERNVGTSAPRYSPPMPSEYSSVEIGAMALQLIRPSKERPIEHPTLSAPKWVNMDDSARMDIEDQEMFSEWIEDVPESPVTSSFNMNHGHVSDEVIAGWTKEDAEMQTMERYAQNDRLRKLGYRI